MGGRRPDLRRGLRERRRLRGRRRDGLRQGRGDLGRRPVQPVVPAGPEGLRLRHQPGLVSRPTRDKTVDFSDSYYDVNQSLVALEGTPITNAKTLDDLKPYKLGAQLGTTSYTYITDTIAPDQDASVYDTNNDVISALKAKQIDGIVVDLPTAFFVTAAQLEGSTIVGQFPAAGEQERFGMVFEEGSSLRDCVNEALATLKDDGRLEEIQTEWLSNKAEAPVIE